ncbi:TonB-dependent receptor [Bacteroides sp. 51]|uniref:TonB-dependent receptor n=1 Tax=Bacteroides sp. 51 TaxID=2302938 RepID=UPI0013D36240|nr:TonB-dependent receptor [Bacteroides sp. 51]NDV83308.1 hypothetical protein [Bacteroides sp. 51]
MNRVVIIIFLIIHCTVAFSQELRLVVSDKPLNTVLSSLNIEVSYDDKALSAYNVTVNKLFATPHEALTYLLQDKPFTIEQIGNVFIILPVKKQLAETPPMLPVPPKINYIISGTILDASNNERLPYAYVNTSRGLISCNQSGRFTITRNKKGPIAVKIRYMGYEDLDTILTVGSHMLALVPVAVSLEEVVVHPSPAAMLMQSGQQSGEVRINHQVAQYMPGGVENSVFTLLRMMPGVRASGESSGDIIVWGSNAGESQIKFDGFTLFGMKNFNEHISSVNPYLVKDIRLLKGGYDASLGNRIGAIAELTGNDGDHTKPVLKANVSNYTANAFISAPVFSRAVLSAAYRQTFYNMYSSREVTQINNPDNEHDSPLPSNVSIEPWYSFRDMNLKLAGNASQKDYYYASLYAADDRFKSSVTNTVKNEEYHITAKEKNRQYGAGLGYEKYWKNGSSTTLHASYSRMVSQIDNVNGQESNDDNTLLAVYTDNRIQEIGVKLQHNQNAGHFQKLKFGIEWKEYTNHLNRKHKELHVPTLFFNDHLMFDKLSIDAGIRADFLPRGSSFIQPRISARYAITEELTTTASWGMYHQFITRIPYQYSPGSYQMAWSLADSTYLQARHLIAGVAYSKNGYLFSLEGYYKSIHNGLYIRENLPFRSNNKIWGGDLYAKKEFRNQTLFGSYSFVGIKNPYDEFGQEIKLGGMASYKNFHLTCTYIFGTGFAYLSSGRYMYDHPNNDDDDDDYDDINGDSDSYQRLDLALTYRLQLKKCKLQISGSLLNLFDNHNVKDRYQLNENNNLTNIYTKATSFTPMISAEIIF